MLGGRVDGNWAICSVLGNA